MRFDVQVEIRIREGVSDPEGATIERSLPNVGFNGVANVRTGKIVQFTLEANNEDEGRAQVEDMCARFLTNPAIEDADITMGLSPSA